MFLLKSTDILISMYFYVIIEIKEPEQKVGEY